MCIFFSLRTLQCSRRVKTCAVMSTNAVLGNREGTVLRADRLCRAAECHRGFIEETWACELNLPAELESGQTNPWAGGSVRKGHDKG